MPRLCGQSPNALLELFRPGDGQHIALAPVEMRDYTPFGGPFAARAWEGHQPLVYNSIFQPAYAAQP